MGSSLTFGVKGIYFPGDHLGFMGEAYFLGLGMADNCTRTFAEPPASTRNNQICASIDGSELPASAVQVAGGLIYRVNSRKTVSPYARGAVGLILSSQSSVAVSGTFNNADNRPVLKEIYPGESSTRIDVSSTLAFGLTAALGPGYQVRWEVRDNIVSLREPTGASLQDGIAPPTARRFHHLFGFEVGFDVVLERRRGRRY